MNKVHLKQILENYLNRFEEMNMQAHGSSEWHKWRMAQAFRAMMNRALSATDEAFPAELLQVKKLTEDLIDGPMQPFYGLCRIAEKAPEEVRDLFCKLLQAEDDGNLVIRSERVHDFIAGSNRLCEQQFPKSYLYKNNSHSVTCYLGLYDPTHNYIFKATEAKNFACYVGFSDDWGAGQNFHLDAYYRMCDQLVAVLEEDASFLTKWKAHWANLPVKQEALYSDQQHHLLAYDIIYASTHYKLVPGIDERPARKSPAPQRTVDIEALKSSYEAAAQREKERQQAEAYVRQVLVAGVKFHHKRYGVGVIQQVSASQLAADFPEGGRKNLDLAIAAANGIDEVDGVTDFAKRIGTVRSVLQQSVEIQRDYERTLKAYHEAMENADDVS